MKQIVNAKAKIGLRFSIIVQNLDICCPKNHYLSNTTSTTKIQIQKTIIKKPHIKKSRLKKAKSANNKTLALPYFNELIKLNCQEKKKKYQKKK